MNGSIRFRDDAEIRRLADEFRESASLRGHNIPPIDVIYIAEIVLKLDVIPLPNLRADQNIDAALLPDLTGFYIDEDAYMSWERGVRWIEQRLRFSFAHELGHYVLHREEIAANRFGRWNNFGSGRLRRQTTGARSIRRTSLRGGFWYRARFC